MFNKHDVIKYLNETGDWIEGVYLNKSEKTDTHVVCDINDEDTWHKVKFVKPVSSNSSVFEIQMLSKMDKIISLLENQQKGYTNE